MAVICLLDNAHLCCYFGKRGKPFLSPFFLFYFSPTPITLLNYVHQLLFHDEETNKENKPRGLPAYCFAVIYPWISRIEL